MSAPLCLASCFLPLDDNNSRWWKRFQDELAHCGMELILLGTSPAADRELRTIVVPLWLRHYSQVFAPPPEPNTLEPPLVEALARRDRAWIQEEGSDLEKFRTGLAACQSVLRTILNELQPAVVLVWGNSLPQSVVLQQLALQQGRPCWIIERGLVPGTLLIDMGGQSGQSELNWSFALTRVLRDAAASDLFDQAQAAYRRNPQTKYAQARALSAEEFHARYNPARRKLIAFTLQHDASSCLLPEDYPGASIHAPGFRSAPGALQALAQAARQEDALVLAKPHPIDHADYSMLETEHLRVLRDVNLHSLIEAADVVACMTSTTQFEALLLEKPILLMARSHLFGKGAAYEALGPEDLPGALHAALQRQAFDQRSAAARRFMDFVLRYYSVAISDNSPAGATLTDLAQFLRRNAARIPCGRASAEGLAALKRTFDRWTASSAGGHRTAIITPQKSESAFPAAMKYHSHIGQDAWVAECLQFKRNGFFLDFGAFDGETISNTLALEETLGWQGICVEPDPRYYSALCACRRCITVNVALWPKSRELVRFLDAHGLSCIEEFSAGDSNAQRRRDATQSVIEVDTLNPTELLARFDAPKLIDYLSLDLEGAEYDILTALDLETYAIALMTIEHNHDRARQEKMRRYLAQFGYEVVQNRNDDFFFHRGHLARLLEGRGAPADPVAICHRLEATYPIAEPGGAPAQHASRPGGVSPQPPTRAGGHAVAPESSLSELRRMADALREKQAWAEAETVYQKLLRAYPDDVGLWRGRLECCRRRGHEVLADLLCEEALERHPEWKTVLAVA